MSEFAGNQVGGSAEPASLQACAQAGGKVALRRHFRRLRPQVGFARNGSPAVADFFTRHFGFAPDLAAAGPLRVASFQPLPGELDVRAFNASFAGQLFLPVYDRRLGFAQAPVFAAVNGGFVGDLRRPEQLILDMILVPGLAFETTGVRLGQGGGWYDRALAGLRAAHPELLVVGCVPSDFLAPAGSLPVESHDFRMDFVLTEKGLMAG